MIGGRDIVLEWSSDSATRRVLVQMLRSAWPEAYVEDARSSGAAVPIAGLDPETLPAEMFVYKNAVSRDTWDADGATDANADTMIHALVAMNTMTLVVDRAAGAESASIAESIRVALLDSQPAGAMITDSYFDDLDAESTWIEAA